MTIQCFKPAAEGRGIGFSGWLAVDNEPDSYGKATILRFPLGGQNPLVSIDTFSSNVARNADHLAGAAARAATRCTRGNVIVVPIGDGLLYTQPIYLDTAAGLAADAVPRGRLVRRLQRVRRLDASPPRCPTPCARASRPTSR